MPKPKKTDKKRGRPPLPMPERIPDTPDNVMRAIIKTPPDKDWQYLSGRKHGDTNPHGNI